MPKVTLFAQNLRAPSHMEWVNGQLLVSEHSAGTIKDITNGGDMKDVAPFAWGLNGPASILPVPGGPILVSESWGGTVRDITGGGDVSGRSAFASGLTGPYSLGRVQVDPDEPERIFVSEHDAQARWGWVSDITAGGSQHPVYVSDQPTILGPPGLTPISSWPQDWPQFAVASCVKQWKEPGTAGKLYISLGALGQILEVPTGGGAYIDLVKNGAMVAWGLHRCGGIKWHTQRNRLFVAEPEAGSIMEVDPATPQHYLFKPPVVRGLRNPTCIRFSGAAGEIMYVCGQADGCVWKIEDF
jgi:hypothetical protein